MNWLRRILKIEPPRYVLLELHDGDTRLRRAYPGQCGWIAKYYDFEDSWVVLYDDGSCSGGRVARWHKHSGWPKE